MDADEDEQQQRDRGVGERREVAEDDEHGGDRGREEDARPRRPARGMDLAEPARDHALAGTAVEATIVTSR
jgi:hypothetical protein